MGPRSIRSRKCDSLAQPHPRSTVLQWGRDRLIAEMTLDHASAAQAAIGFNGAAIMSIAEIGNARGDRHGLSASMGPRSFDRGNLDFRDGPDATHASMGPRSLIAEMQSHAVQTACAGFNGAAIIDRGNVSRAIDSRLRGFNGAAIIDRGNGDRQPSNSWQSWLQWGRDR